VRSPDSGSELDDEALVHEEIEAAFTATTTMVTA
jgi:hypothetical protein